MALRMATGPVDDPLMGPGGIHSLAAALGIDPAQLAATLGANGQDPGAGPQPGQIGPPTQLTAPDPATLYQPPPPMPPAMQPPQGGDPPVGASPRPVNASTPGFAQATPGFAPITSPSTPGDPAKPMYQPVPGTVGAPTAARAAVPASVAPSASQSVPAPPAPLGAPRIPQAAQVPQSPAGVNATTAPRAPTAALANNAQLPVSAYTQSVRDSLQPTFTAQDQSLAENLAGMGILNSGAANKSFQDLTGQQSAAISSAVSPLIEQGYQNEANTNVSNAAARNAAASQGYGGANSNYQLGQQLGQQSSLANQQTQTTYDLANLGALNSQQLAQLGYSNQDYQQMIQALYGITTGGQNASNVIAEGSVPYGSQAYQAGMNLASGGAAGMGAGSVGAPTSGTGTAPGVGPAGSTWGPTTYIDDPANNQPNTDPYNNSGGG